MRGRIPIFYSALMLTATNLLLRFVGTSFQVYLSTRVGAAGIGLLQLVMSVGGFAMVAGIAGIRTASMYLTAEELGKNKPENVSRILSVCFLYSIFCSCAVGTSLYLLAPFIGTYWIGDDQTIGAIRLFAAFLPTTCLCAVMTGYFTAANRIGTLAIVEVCEQFFSMTCTVTLLTFWGQDSPPKACQCIILGSSAGSCLTLLLLILLRIREKPTLSSRIPVQQRLYRAAIPLALGDIVKTGINTVENLIVPRQLSLNKSIISPLAAFGTVSGMVFPVLMFPACILFGLAELLIPELARCNAAGNRLRTSYLVQKSLRIALLYGSLFCGILFLIGQPLCLQIYGNTHAGVELKRYALLIPMLYCDTITDAMTKGLGQQKECVRYNIFTSAMDVIILYILLPKYGMSGYFFSFFITHLVNFFLSHRRLTAIAGKGLHFSDCAFTAAATITAVWFSSYVHSPIWRTCAYSCIWAAVLCLTNVINRQDLLWLKGLVLRNKKHPA